MSRNESSAAASVVTRVNMSADGGIETRRVPETQVRFALGRRVNGEMWPPKTRDLGVEPRSLGICVRGNGCQRPFGIEQVATNLRPPHLPGATWSKRDSMTR